jgi:hypothetical protein
MLLRGATGFIETRRPIIYAEFNSLFLRQMGMSFVDAANIMSPFGYRMFTEEQTGDATGTHFRSGCFTPVESVRPGIQYVLMVPRETSATTMQSLGLPTG